MHIRLTIPIMRFVFGKGIGRHNATQIRESWLSGQVADMMELVWDCGHPGLRAKKERQRLLNEGGRETQDTGTQRHVRSLP